MVVTITDCRRCCWSSTELHSTSSRGGNSGVLQPAPAWDLPIPQFTAGPQSLGAPAPGPFPGSFNSARPTGSRARVTIFLLSVPRFACLDMVSTAQRRLASRRHSPDPRPQQTLIQSSRGPSDSGTDQPRLTAPAQSGAEHFGTCGSVDQSPTTAPDCPTGSPAYWSESDAAPGEPRAPACLCHSGR